MTNEIPPIHLIDYRGASRTIPIRGCKVTIEDLKRLYSLLSVSAEAAVETHLSGIPPLEGKNPEEEAQLRDNVRKLGQLTVTIIDAHGGQRVNQSVDCLKPENLPDKIETITFDSTTGFANTQISLMNKFQLHLDFTDTPGFNIYNPIDHETPNYSRFEVTGADEAWVNNVTQKVTNFFNERKSTSLWLHNRRLFVFITWLLLIPSSFWIAYGIDNFLIPKDSDIHIALRGSLNVYFFLLTFFVLRYLFWALRWAYPVIELVGTKQTFIRWVINTVFLSYILKIIYDAGAAFLSSS